MNAPARFLCVGTHHKTGTVWMRRTFHKFATAESIPVVRVNQRSLLKELPSDGPALVVNWSSSFPMALFNHPQARFLHIIRDPRDVLLSGYRYHLVAPTGNEKFLRTPHKSLSGKTYQEHLNSLSSRVEGLLFEMEHKHAETLTEMLLWPYGHPHTVDLRYEDLINDTDCALFDAAIRGLDVPAFDHNRLMKSYWDHSLFGALADPKNRKPNVKSHIKSASTAQWRSNLPREVATGYAARFSAALAALGYAHNDDWVNECLPEAELTKAAARASLSSR